MFNFKRGDLIALNFAGRAVHIPEMWRMTGVVMEDQESEWVKVKWSGGKTQFDQPFTEPDEYISRKGT